MKGKAIPGNNKKNLPNIATADDCKNLCLAETWCVSIDYSTSKKRCHLAKITRNVVPLHKFRGWDYYEVTKSMYNDNSVPTNAGNTVFLPNPKIPSIVSGICVLCI